MDHPWQNIDYKKLLEHLGPEVINTLNEAQAKKDAEDFCSLKEGLNKGICYLCGNHIDSIDSSMPCFHWLINPKVKKKQLEKVLMAGRGLLHLYGYLTWVANSEKPFVNIDDTTDGLDLNKIFETTIKYKEFEWSFSLAHSDLAGHKGTRTDFPHFHFQMKKNGYTIIKFNDYHIPFSNNDLIQFEMHRQDVLALIPGFEAGIAALGKIPSQELNMLLERSTCDDTASFRTRTVLYVPKENEHVINEQIKELRETTKMTAPQIADYLNRVYGYGIEFDTISIPIQTFYKAHRN